MNSAAPIAVPPPVAEAPLAPPQVEAENLVKRYGPRRVVNGLSFDVARGEILGLLGPNGAGKTTTLRMLAGFIPPTHGAARIAGFDVLRQSLQARRRLGYLPERAPLYDSMRVRDYLRFMSEAKDHPRATRPTYVARAIDEFALADVADRRIGALSRGFRQRVALAQAALGDPPVLILDEPTVGLDPRQIAEIRDRIRRMAGSRTVILSTHLLPEVSLICQRVLVLDRGRAVASGTPEKLASTLEDSGAILVKIHGDLNRAHAALARLNGIQLAKIERTADPRVATFHARKTSTADPRPEIARAAVAAGLDLLELSTAGLSLEEVFLRVVSDPAGPEDA